MVQHILLSIVCTIIHSDNLLDSICNIRFFCRARCHIHRAQHAFQAWQQWCVFKRCQQVAAAALRRRHLTQHALHRWHSEWLPRIRSKQQLARQQACKVKQDAPQCTARYNNWLLINLTPKGVVFPFLFSRTYLWPKSTAIHARLHMLDPRENIYIRT